MCKIKTLFAQKAAVNAVIAQEKAKLKELDKEINALVSEEFAKSRQAQDKHTGSLTLMFDGGTKVKQTVPKKVVWDQDKLNDCWRQLQAANITPTDYIDAKYSVSEKTYSQLPENVKKWIQEARTEDHGAVKLEIVDEK